MLLGYLTLFGYVLVLSFFGWPLFVYELCRHHLQFRYHPAGALAFVSVLFAFLVLDFIGSVERMYRIHLGSWGWLISGVWLYTPLVCWLILRVRRARKVTHDRKET